MAASQTELAVDREMILRHARSWIWQQPQKQQAKPQPEQKASKDSWRSKSASVCQQLHGHIHLGLG